ncbi:unnamed protein product [Phyllotreta striolata]|uniref:Uncharacterized protein n=1 Tax=Phyllotreta striolata TaxID=444603 RepID=A0A9N9TPN6_PHYSR|nr:unnamed protein product [Phyllotreta striolata]
MAAYAEKDPFAWPFQEIQPEQINVHSKNYSTFVDFLLSKIQESKQPVLISSSMNVLSPEISLDDSSLIENGYRSHQDDYTGEYSKSETTSLFNIEQSTEVTDTAFYYSDKMVDNLMTAKQKVFTHAEPCLDTITTTIRTTLTEYIQDPFAWPCKSVKPQDFHINPAPNFKRPDHETTTEFSNFIGTIRTKPGYFVAEISKRMTETLSNSTRSSQATDQPITSYLGQSLDNLMMAQNTTTNSTSTLSTTITSAWTEGVSSSNVSLHWSSLVSAQIRPPIADWKNTTPVTTARANLTTLISLFKFEHDNDNVTTARNNDTIVSEMPSVFRNFNRKFMEAVEETTVDRGVGSNSTATPNDKPTTLFEINYDEVTTMGWNEDGNGTVRYVQDVIGARTNEEVLVYAMEESQGKDCYFYILLIVVLVLLLVIAGVFLFYRMVKRNRGYGYKVSQMKGYRNSENDNDVIIV